MRISRRFFCKEEGGGGEGGGYKKIFFSQQFKIIFKKTTYDRSVKYLLSPQSWRFVFFGGEGGVGGLAGRTLFSP